MATMLNAARILDLQARLLGVDHDGLAELALAAPPGSNGLRITPYYDGERTPNRPNAHGTWDGLTTSTTREDVARAAVEALLCSLADGLDAVAQFLPHVGQVLLIGGGARHRAVREIAPSILGRPMTIPGDAQYVALGAARQAAWALSGADAPPVWPLPQAEVREAEPHPFVREAYAHLRDRTAVWS